MTLKFKSILFFIFTVSLSGCSSTIFNSESKTTIYHDDACLIIKENPDWLSSMIESYNKWKTPISIQLAFVRQESSFRHDARPIRPNKWHEFATNYQSSALGYSQALDGTWQDYEKSTNQNKKDRTSFKDSVDFIGWYNHQTRKKLKLSRTDGYSLYLAYHEGWGGYKRGSYKNKKFLQNAGWKVHKWAYKYSEQLNKCKVR